MDSKILFLNLSNDDDQFSQDRQKMSETIKELSNPDEYESFKKDEKNKVQDKLSSIDKNDVDLLILWVDSEHCSDWIEVSDLIEKQKQPYYLGFVIIFGVEEDKIEDNMEKAMLRNIYPFICPINYTNLKEYLKAIISGIKYKKSLEKLVVIR